MKMSSIASFLSLLLVVFSSPTLKAEEAFGYRLTTDVVYGTAKITKEGNVIERDLLMDVYQPFARSSDRELAAVILVHGGAFHRGGLRQPPYRELGAVHSGMQDYARLLAPLGYVCFVIEYRLTQELPILDMAPDAEGLQSYAGLVTEHGLSRTNFARRALGLPEVTSDDDIVIWNGVLAPAEDFNKAVRKIIASAREFGIDPGRIAAGGHSAGATTVLNAAYGIKTPVKAVFPMSPSVYGFDFEKTLNSPELPAMLLLMAQNDLEPTYETVPGLLEVARNAGLDYSFAWVPGFGHFYPTGAASLGDDGSRMSVGERVIQFLDKHLKN